MSFHKDSVIPDIHKAPQTVQVQLNIAVDHYDYQGTYQNLSDLLKKDVPFISHEYFFVLEGVCCWLNTFCVCLVSQQKSSQRTYRWGRPGNLTLMPWPSANWRRPFFFVVSCLLAGCWYNNRGAAGNHHF